MQQSKKNKLGGGYDSAASSGTEGKVFWRHVIKDIDRARWRGFCGKAGGFNGNGVK